MFIIDCLALTMLFKRKGRISPPLSYCSQALTSCSWSRRRHLRAEDPRERDTRNDVRGNTIQEPLQRHAVGHREACIASISISYRQHYSGVESVPNAFHQSFILVSLREDQDEEVCGHEAHHPEDPHLAHHVRTPHALSLLIRRVQQLAVHNEIHHHEYNKDRESPEQHFFGHCNLR